jgi:hypothetical protein
MLNITEILAYYNGRKPKKTHRHYFRICSRLPFKSIIVEIVKLHPLKPYVYTFEALYAPRFIICMHLDYGD